MVMFALDSLNYGSKPYSIMWSRLVVNGKEIRVNDASGILKHALNHTSQITLQANQNISVFILPLITMSLRTRSRWNIFWKVFLRSGPK